MKTELEAVQELSLSNAATEKKAEKEQLGEHPMDTVPENKNIYELQDGDYLKIHPSYIDNGIGGHLPQTSETQGDVYELWTPQVRRRKGSKQRQSRERKINLSILVLSIISILLSSLTAILATSLIVSSENKNCAGLPAVGIPRHQAVPSGLNLPFNISHPLLVRSVYNRKMLFAILSIIN